MFCPPEPCTRALPLDPNGGCLGPIPQVICPHNLAHQLQILERFLKIVSRIRTCHCVRHGVHNRCPHGSIRMSLSFSAQILHNWKVEPISQYSSYCSCVTFIWSSSESWTRKLRSGLIVRPSGYLKLKQTGNFHVYSIFGTNRHSWYLRFWIYFSLLVTKVLL